MIDNQIDNLNLVFFPCTTQFTSSTIIIKMPKMAGSLCDNQ